MLAGVKLTNPPRRLKLLVAAIALAASAVIGALMVGLVQSQVVPPNVEVRVTAQRLSDGRVEFALQQRLDGQWESRILPRSRFFPTSARVNRWLSSTSVRVYALDYVPPEPDSMTDGSDPVPSASAFTNFTAQQVAALRARDFCAEGFWGAASPSEAVLAIQQGADLTCEDEDTGESPLHWAAKDNVLGVVKLLLARNVIVDHADANGATPLIEAAWSNPDESVVSALVNAGANVNHRLSDGQSPLHQSAFNDNHKVMATLLRLGADIEAKSDSGARAFHYTAARGTPGHLTLLTQSFARTDRKANTGWTAMHYAAANNPDAGVIQTLITLGLSANSRDDEGQSPLHVAVRYGETRMGAANAERIILALIGVGADVNGQIGTGVRGNEFGSTPLLYAAQYVEDVDIVRTLLDSGADKEVGRFGNILGACSGLHFRDSSLQNTQAIRNLLQCR